MTARREIGDCRDVLRRLIAEGVKVQMCVTSPPYWGLRDYGVEGQIGLEKTLDEYLTTMVEVFRLVREVMADDGTLWLNMGDCYTTRMFSHDSLRTVPVNNGEWCKEGQRGVYNGIQPPQSFSGLKPKDLIGMPWRLAFALQSDGWYLRSDIIWHKPNSMPESVTDRPTKSHEYLFLLTKSPRYFYDSNAVREAESGQQGGNIQTASQKWGQGSRYGPSVRTTLKTPTGTRNLRTVWTITSLPFKDAHFATFPPKLVEPCIVAGSRPGDIVLDPFLGSGTVAEVAQHLGRGWIGIDLNPAYEPMQRKRTAQQGMALHA